MSEPKKTPFTHIHEQLKAKMVKFSGWYMPVYYTNIIDEHITTRTKAGLFDTSHMGELTIKGRDALNLIQKVITNDASKLVNNKGIYSCMCYENGTIVDDLFVFKFDDDDYYIVANAGTIEKDFNWIKRHSVGMNVELENVSDETAKLDLQGPNAEKILQKLTDTNLSQLKRPFLTLSKVATCDTIISRTGYTGEDGFELFFNYKFAVNIWDKLLEAGKKFGLKPAGLGARDTLRIEACYSLYGHEINESITPIEAGLGFVVKLDKGDFIGRSILETQKLQGTARTLVCFEMVYNRIARENYEIFNNDEKIGYVTSGTFSPTFKKSIGMGLIKREFAKVGNEIRINVRDKKYRARIVERPFYRYHGK